MPAATVFTLAEPAAELAFTVPAPVGAGFAADGFVSAGGSVAGGGGFTGRLRGGAAALFRPVVSSGDAVAEAVVPDGGLTPIAVASAEPDPAGATAAGWCGRDWLTTTGMATAAATTAAATPAIAQDRERVAVVACRVSVSLAAKSGVCSLARPARSR
ncbi:hypothetical protein [Nakamurella aerolata]|uniref:Uncharacterized protein n=1 Tax=Nakamurella aerolata TaxID=1656892 RepID=A0A849A4A0_9ACTN|nr:hypothetical protein [Nakamurella aerolata]NNG34486.1 hypothetical protein [Nakamurella aerolata]